jgi:hypothetical protein
VNTENEKAVRTLIKYRIKTQWIEPKITPVEILRETEQSIFTAGWKGKEQRHAKKTGYEAYFDTWEAAHAALLNIAENELEYARRKLERAQGTYGNIKGMKKP